jgi:hypothetical protein
MKRDGDAPALGSGGLHVRPGYDVPAVDPTDTVNPGEGGMSTAPDDPRLLPTSMRPKSLGGTGRRPVWAITARVLPSFDLESRADGPRHELVEPARAMELKSFEGSLHATVAEWTMVGE